jgi:molybdopterin converting factor small subunit
VTADAAATVTLELPSILRTVTGWRRTELRGRTIGEALEAAFEKTPVLRHHMTLDSGELRPHILCILNDETLPREEVRSTTLADGDEILIHQAISGG